MVSVSATCLVEDRAVGKGPHDLVVTVASGKRKLVELEDRILQLLSTVKGSLLDDESLVETLQASKITAEEVTESLKIAEEVRPRRMWLDQPLLCLRVFVLDPTAPKSCRYTG